ncbi:MAG: DNA repair protein RecO [Dehalococcoidia bacterium]|nr:DNA repair protein RecO [Dehalococcoidia bacterium]MCA9824709.1 DNA repair protein RecO [Dehalococcoidia bacterium]
MSGTRPRIFRAEGIVLRRRNIGEADSVFTVLGTDGRRFEAVARGVRKTRSRMRGHLEPLTHGKFLIAAGKSLDVFTQVETVNAYRTIREDLDRSSAAIYCCELAERFTVEGEGSGGLFALLRACLEALGERPSPLVLRYFEFHVLMLTGFALQLGACALCGCRLPEEPALFSASAGGLACRACRHEAGIGRLVSVPAIKMLRYASQANVAQFCDVTAAGDVLADLESALGESVVYQLDRRPAARQFIDDVAALRRQATAGGESR